LPFFPSPEPVGRNGQGISTGINRRKVENTGVVRYGVAFSFGGLVLRTTVAFGMTAPLESATVPLMDPVALWPNKDKLLNKTVKSKPITR
jgi:hypothetical protein